jgi:hypothetical protein
MRYFKINREVGELLDTQAFSEIEPLHRQQIIVELFDRQRSVNLIELKNRYQSNLVFLLSDLRNSHDLFETGENFELFDLYDVRDCLLRGMMGQ